MHLSLPLHCYSCGNMLVAMVSPTVPASNLSTVQVAYVPQAAFIFNASVRDNILFGLPHDAARYERAIKASALDTDLRNMPGEMLHVRSHLVKPCGYTLC